MEEVKQHRFHLSFCKVDFDTAGVAYDKGQEACLLGGAHHIIQSGTSRSWLHSVNMVNHSISRIATVLPDWSSGLANFCTAGITESCGQNMAGNLYTVYTTGIPICKSVISEL